MCLVQRIHNGWNGDNLTTQIFRELEEEFYFESKESHYFLDINVFLIITVVRGKEKRKSERRSVD